MDCSSQNLIYALICGNCKKKTYIGETGEILRNRVRVHRQQIDSPSLMNLKVSHHIKTYIGETGDILRNRVRVHRQQIDSPSLMNLKVSHHISQCSKHVQK